MPEEEQSTFTWQEKKKALKRQLHPYKSTLWLLIILGVISAAANGVVPYLTGKFFDTLVTPYNFAVWKFGTFPAWAVLLTAWAVVQLVANGVGWFMDRSNRQLATKLNAGIQAKGFITLLRLPVSFYKHNRSGEVVDILNKAGWMLDAMVGTVISIAPQFLTIIIGVAIAFTLNVQLALILLAGLAVYGVVLLRIIPPMAEYQLATHRAWGKAHGDAYDAYANIMTVKQANAEAYEINRIRDSYWGKAIPLWNRIERRWSDLNFSQRVIVTLTQGTILAVAVYFVYHGTLTIGGLIAFNAYAGMIIGPFVSLGQQWQTIQNGLIAAARSEQIFAAEPEIYEPENAVTLKEIKGAIDFEHVHFRYEPDQPDVLSDVSFSVEPGTVVALVGETGAGKSTTAELVSGYYMPTDGTVRVDGVDVRKLNLNQLRSAIAVVPQEVVLFNAKIIDNIRYGRPDATYEGVRAAAQKAHADGFIENFPKQYKQEVGERGIKLSVGQKQRVAIARAMLRNPSILILDEPTSALDAETEQYITKSLEDLMKGRTTFIIAHRLSTVRKADLILVLKDGKIVERGSHDELMQIPDGSYRHLYELHIGLHE